MKLRSEWLEEANRLTTDPGVYVMSDAAGEVVYVGKAKNLKNRVRGYFQEKTSDVRPFIHLLEGVIDRLDTYVTASEKEALLLEREMIRKHEPRFNVIWRDDKQYLCLKVDLSHPYPWVQVVRNYGEDGARYFGPFHSASSARQTLRVLNRHFKLRTCRDSALQNRKRACLEYQIGRCLAPCVQEIDRGLYDENVRDVLLFLEGKGDELVRALDERMWGASEREDFEVAARYRDQARAVRKTTERQAVARPEWPELDALGLHREGTELAVAVLKIREGRVRDLELRFFEDADDDDAALLRSLLVQRYTSMHALEAIPKQVLLPRDIAEPEAVGEVISEHVGRGVASSVPKRGPKAELVKLALKNARHGLQEERRKSGALERTIARLRDLLKLSRTPRVIECFDISNLGGEDIVASKVRFVDGLPEKNGYRRFKLRQDSQDDFRAMNEVVQRRLRRGHKEGDLPDLLLVDGGRGQLSAALEALQEEKIDGVDLASLAKARHLGDSSYSCERVFRPGASEPIELRPRSPESLFLERIRDEAHRFAITYQRNRRQARRGRSRLDDIPGIGPKRRRALLTAFGSPEALMRASTEEIARVPGVGAHQAAEIHAYFRSGTPAGGATKPTKMASEGGKTQ